MIGNRDKMSIWGPLAVAAVLVLAAFAVASTIQAQRVARARRRTFATEPATQSLSSRSSQNRAFLMPSAFGSKV